VSLFGVSLNIIFCLNLHYLFNLLPFFHRYLIVFIPLLYVDNLEVEVETMRALGNFTQSENARNILVQTDGKRIDCLDNYCGTSIFFSIQFNISFSSHS